MNNWKKKYERAKARKTQLIGDNVIRNALISTFKNVPYLEEVRLEGLTADVVQIGEVSRVLVGFEIKSDRDTFDRLESQLRLYLKYFNVVVLVTTFLHCNEALRVLKAPEFENVGLLVYEMTENGAVFQEVKKPVFTEVKGNYSSLKISRKSQLFQWLHVLEGVWG